MKTYLNTYYRYIKKRIAKIRHGKFDFMRPLQSRSLTCIFYFDHDKRSNILQIIIIIIACGIRKWGVWAAILTGS